MFRCLVGEIGGQSLSGREQFLLVDDVVPIKYGPRFVTGEQHGDPFRHAGPDQVARGGTTTIVQQAVRDLRLPTGIT